MTGYLDVRALGVSASTDRGNALLENGELTIRGATAVVGATADATEFNYKILLVNQSQMNGMGPNYEGVRQLIARANTDALYDRLEGLGTVAEYQTSMLANRNIPFEIKLTYDQVIAAYMENAKSTYFKFLDGLYEGQANGFDAVTGPQHQKDAAAWQAYRSGSSAFQVVLVVDTNDDVAEGNGAWGEEFYNYYLGNTIAIPPMTFELMRKVSQWDAEFQQLKAEEARAEAEAQAAAEAEAKAKAEAEAQAAAEAKAKAEAEAQAAAEAEAKAKAEAEAKAAAEAQAKAEAEAKAAAEAQAKAEAEAKAAAEAEAKAKAEAEAAAAEDDDASDVLTMVGSNASYDPETGEYILTPDEYSQWGRVQDSNPYALAADFTYEFEAYFGDDNNGADGIVWFMHGDRTAALDLAGSAGGTIGMAGMSGAFILEMDTWYNGADYELGAPNYEDGGDHVMLRAQMETDGGVDRGFRKSEAATPGDLEDGAYHAVKITWTAATGTLTWSIDGEVLGTATFDEADADGDGFGYSDLAEVLGSTDEVYFGISAATGGARNLQKIRNIEWDAAEGEIIEDEPETEEPGDALGGLDDATDGDGSDDTNTEEQQDTRADLTIADISFVDGKSNDYFVSVDVSNIGGDRARKATTTLFWSETDTFDAETAVELVSEHHGTIDGGATDTDEVARVRSEVLEELGSGFIFAVADNKGFVDEADETNNISEALAVTIETPAEPEEEEVVEEVVEEEVTPGTLDIVMESLKLNRTTVSPTKDIKVTVSLGNEGTADAQSVETKIYWSATDTFDASTAVAIETDNHGMLRGESSDDVESLVLRYRDVADLGDGYIFAVADADDKLAEIDETNNISTGVAITVDNGAGAGEVDLAIKSMKIKDTELDEGEDLRIVLDVANEGNAKARATATTFYWSETDTFDFATATEIGRDTHQTLDGGEVDRGEKQRVDYDKIADLGDGYIFGYISTPGAIDIDLTDNLGGGIWVDVL
ncbi:lectin-like domain-containing protein [Pseudoprimorskyibacter insulae]|uniref:Pesticidal crystal protein Cry22Aa n=1 Tax=Pseudoprimorskyibacter insulae TaxID=1695997 RepID=A0A2R8ANZ5_9RHOB|nr:CARDB domain-containing protein [Pseudoprimorskyibacter insulae]SPF77700.1 Pesticidal crystal protein Cry22Aa [Pseudoprimorskyibacter insulae]